MIFIPHYTYMWAYIIRMWAENNKRLEQNIDIVVLQVAADLFEEVEVMLHFQKTIAYSKQALLTSCDHQKQSFTT